jgi:hypothetical protein
LVDGGVLGLVRVSAGVEVAAEVGSEGPVGRFLLRRLVHLDLVFLATTPAYVVASLALDPRSRYEGRNRHRLRPRSTRSCPRTG